MPMHWNSVGNIYNELNLDLPDLLSITIDKFQLHLPTRSLKSQPTKAQNIALCLQQRFLELVYAELSLCSAVILATSPIEWETS